MKYTASYLKEIKRATGFINRSFLLKKTIVLSGATGMILSYLIDVLLMDPTLPVTLIALVRDIPLAKQRFVRHQNDSRLHFQLYQVSIPLSIEDSVDYVIHGASTTDPKSYQSNPVETMTLNVLGTYHMLELAKSKHAKFLLLSSTEVYGQLDQEQPIEENALGYLNLQDPRSSYNEGKRAAETLCAAYHQQHHVHVLIARLSRVYGPTLKATDTKALSQFIFATLQKKPIVLRSLGLQKFSYLYVEDAVQGLLLLLDKGMSNEAYNVAHPEVLSLKDIATLLANLGKVKVQMDLQKESNMAYSKTTYAIQSIDKMLSLGFQPRVGLKEGLTRTLNLFKKLG